jgi:hypothetical protein
VEASLAEPKGRQIFCAIAKSLTRETLHGVLKGKTSLLATTKRLLGLLLDAVVSQSDFAAGVNALHFVLRCPATLMAGLSRS